MLGEAVAWAE